ncbi:hypothetical protein [Streptomyces adustus]|uniref:hypothetical protein n=1 Tax=Streptomyces adustus TaxID=1609272 RepID=UPI003715C6BB
MIARGLGESERTVVRRSRHLAQRHVTVAALAAVGETAVARRADTIFTYVLTGTAGCVANSRARPTGWRRRCGTTSLGWTA